MKKARNHRAFSFAAPLTSSVRFVLDHYSCLVQPSANGIGTTKVFSLSSRFSLRLEGLNIELFSVSMPDKEFHVQVSRERKFSISGIGVCDALHKLAGVLL